MRLPEGTGRGVRVGVVDSGWDRALADPRVRPGMAIVVPDGGGAPELSDDDHDRMGHGTACADLVLRVAPEAEVVPIRVFGARLETSAAVLAAAVRWGVAEGLHLLNLSLGTLAIHGVVPLYAACEGARRGGTTVVAAAHAGRGWSCPAIFANAIGVGALEGAERALEVRPDEAVECLAPAEHHGVRAPGGALRRVRGTSFAAPVVTGIAARLLERNPGAGLEEVREMLRRFAGECVSA